MKIPEVKGKTLVKMNSRNSSLSVILRLLTVTLLLAVNGISAFVPTNGVKRSKSATFMIAQHHMPPSDYERSHVLPDQESFRESRTAGPAAASGQSSPLSNGIRAYLSSSATESSSISLSLKERRPPTAEELAAKKLNFNLWFWGGGFVAPLLATIFYFGPKFWTNFLR